jgi:hypothetical protein
VARRAQLVGRRGLGSADLNTAPIYSRVVGDFVVPSISESREIPAPAAAIFAVLSNPAMHPLIDGTGMAQSAEGNAIITEVGDVFVMNMTHWSLGDYGMENHVVDFVPDRRIVWEPRAHTYQTSEFPGDKSVPETRYWGWDLEPLEVSLTRVTEFYDGSRLSEGLRTFIKDGEFWRKGMVESLENLERLVSAPTVPGIASTGDSTSDPATKRRNYFEEVQRTE